MTVIGVTGPSGAGKSLFCSYLEELGCLHLDCDKTYHSLVDSPSDCTRALEAEFGASVIKPDGSLDRIALGAIVFAPGNAAIENSDIFALSYCFYTVNFAPI